MGNIACITYLVNRQLMHARNSIKPSLGVLSPRQIAVLRQHAPRAIDVPQKTEPLDHDCTQKSCLMFCDCKNMQVIVRSVVRRAANQDISDCTPRVRPRFARAPGQSYLSPRNDLLILTIAELQTTIYSAVPGEGP